MPLPRSFRLNRNPAVESILKLWFFVTLAVLIYTAIPGLPTLPDLVKQAWVAFVIAAAAYSYVDYLLISVRKLEVQAGSATVMKGGREEDVFRPEDVSEISMIVWTGLKSLDRKPDDWPAYLHSKRRWGRGPGYRSYLTIVRKDGATRKYRMRASLAPDIRAALVEAGFAEPKADLR